MSDPFLFTGPEFLANATTSGLQTDASVHGIVGGGYVAVWTHQSGPGSQIRAQLFDDVGVAVGAELTLADHGVSYASRPEVLGLSGGGFALSYTSNHDGNSLDIYSQMFDPAGAAIGALVQVNSSPNKTHFDSQMTELNNGTVVHTYIAINKDGNGQGIFSQRFDSTGAKIGPEIQVNDTIQGDQTLNAVSYLKDGGFVVAYASKSLDGSNFGIAMKRFDADGTAQSSEQQVNQFASDSQTNPDVTVLSDGSLVVTWQSKDQDGEGYGIFARVMDADGNFLGDEFQVNATSAGNQTNPVIQGLPDGGYYILWSDQYAAIMGQRFSLDHVAVGAQTQVSSASGGAHQNPEIALLGSGDLIVTYGTSNDGSSSGILGQMLEGVYIGTDGDDVLIDLAETGRMFGAKGADQLSGLEGVDRLVGQQGADILKGNKGADVLKGGQGQDVLNGGFGNDVLIGGNGADYLIGGRGNDTLRGGQGADTFEFAQALGRDVIEDFDPTLDVLRLSDSLWIGPLDAEGILAQFSQMHDGSLRLKFDEGERVDLHGITDIADLLSAIEIF